MFQVRVVCMSDTHAMTPHIRFDIPEGDIFIHAGDFSRCGQREEVIEFNRWIGKVVPSCKHLTGCCRYSYINLC